MLWPLSHCLHVIDGVRALALALKPVTDAIFFLSHPKLTLVPMPVFQFILIVSGLGEGGG